MPRQAIDRMSREIMAVLGDRFLAGYLYGSAAMNDFRLGWSDIDVLYLSRGVLTEDEADRLVCLRQALLQKEPDNPYYRSFEGAILSWTELKSGKFQRVVYWGTSGQRITNHYGLNAFSRLELLKYGKLLAGEDIRAEFIPPTHADLTAAVRFHYDTIRAYAVRTDETLYSCGWLLDIARCLYTLRTGDVIAKTQAGEWALQNHLCPDEETMRRALSVRKAPLQYKEDPGTKSWLSSLGPKVQAFADVLEKEISAAPFR